jgi:hypothetical protein
MPFHGVDSDKKSPPRIARRTFLRIAAKIRGKVLTIRQASAKIQ